MGGSIKIEAQRKKEKGGDMSRKMDDAEIILTKALLAKFLEEHKVKAPVMIGIFPIAAPSFDREVPWDLIITGEEPVEVSIEDPFFWEAIKNGLTIAKGDALIAVISYDSASKKLVALMAEVCKNGSSKK